MMCTPGRHRDDRGAITTFAVVFTGAVLFVVGLVWDGGRMLATQRQIDNEAASAARAAAQAIDIDRWRAGETTNLLDLDQAQDNMCEYLVAVGRGCGGNVNLTSGGGGTEVTVTIQVTVDLPILGLSRTLDGEGTACAEVGISSAIVNC